MRKYILFIIATVLGAVTLRAQSVSDLIISEVMVENENSVTDEYGNHGPWVEMYNTSTGTVNFAGCYFSDDRANLTKSPIVKGDNRTKIGPRQVGILYASGNSALGTFHLNFRLREGSTLYFVSNDGKTIIDSLVIPVGITPGMSISKLSNDPRQLIFDNGSEKVPSPMSINGKGEQKSRAEILKETDPHGFTLSIVSVTVVFCALLILLTIYTFTGKLFSGQIKIKKPAKKKVSTPKGGSGNEAEIAAAIAMALDAEMGGEAEAAIAMAMHLYLSEAIHDSEPFVITIRKNPASAWNDRTSNFRKTVR